MTGRAQTPGHSGPSVRGPGQPTEPRARGSWWQRFRRPGLAGRLLTVQVLVLSIGSAAAALTASAVAPALFHEHLLQAGHAVTDAQRWHIEEAFTSAGLIALAAALSAALIAALAASWYVGRRIRGTLFAITEAAAAVRAGHYEVEVPGRGGTELATLAGAFNDMAARLASVEQTRRRLLTDLAHELRNPIATLDGYLEGLEDGLVDWGPQTAALLREQTGRLTHLADDLREVSRAQEGALPLDRTPCDIEELLRDAVTAAREAYARKGVLLTRDQPPGGTELLLRVDRHRIGQVLANLLGNALRHTASGGTVCLRTRVVADEVRLEVTDTGEGISAGALPHVFDRFFRSDTSTGTGVGLTISRALVEAHGGRLSAASPGLGHGATLTISLPRNDFGPITDPRGTAVGTAR